MLLSDGSFWPPMRDNLDYPSPDPDEVYRTAGIWNPPPRAPRPAQPPPVSPPVPPSLKVPPPPPIAQEGALRAYWDALWHRGVYLEVLTQLGVGQALWVETARGLFTEWALRWRQVVRREGKIPPNLPWGRVHLDLHTMVLEAEERELARQPEPDRARKRRRASRKGQAAPPEQEQEEEEEMPRVALSQAWGDGFIPLVLSWPLQHQADYAGRRVKRLAAPLEGDLFQFSWNYELQWATAALLDDTSCWTAEEPATEEHILQARQRFLCVDAAYVNSGGETDSYKRRSPDKEEAARGRSKTFEVLLRGQGRGELPVIFTGAFVD